MNKKIVIKKLTHSQLRGGLLKLLSNSLTKINKLRHIGIVY